MCPDVEWFDSIRRLWFRRVFMFDSWTYSLRNQLQGV